MTLVIFFSRLLGVRMALYEEATQGTETSSTIANDVLHILAWVLAFAAARAWPHRVDRLVVVAAGLLMALSGHNTARLSDAQARPQREEVRALLERVEELPSVPGVDLIDVVIGRRPLGDALPLAFPDRDVRAGMDLDPVKSFMFLQG